MIYRGLWSDRIGRAYAVVLRLMIEIIDGSNKQLTVAQLFAATRASLGSSERYVRYADFARALSYLIGDQIVVVQGQTVRKTLGGNGRILRRILSSPEVISRLTQRRTAKKTAKKPVRGGGRRRRPAAAPRERDIQTLPQVRMYRDLPTEQYRVPVFYATNRERDENGHYLNSGVPAEKIDHGQATVLFPNNHRPGYLEEPRRFDFIATFMPRRYVQIEESKRLPKSHFKAKLRTQLKVHSNAVFVFVHGFNVTFDAALKRTAQIALDTSFQGCAIAFSWCSQGDVRRYTGDLQRIEDSATALGTFLADLRDAFPDTTIHVVSHSMGAKIASRAIQTHGQQIGASEIVLQAPDISTVDYGKMADSLVANSRRVTIYSNKNDRALSGSHMTSGYHRIGVSVIRSLHAGIDAVDCTGVGDGTFWQHDYAFRIRLIIDLRETLDGVGQVRAQLEGRLHAKSGNRYFVFRRA